MTITTIAILYPPLLYLPVQVHFNQFYSSSAQPFKHYRCMLYQIVKLQPTVLNTATTTTITTKNLLTSWLMLSE